MSAATKVGARAPSDLSRAEKFWFLATDKAASEISTPTTREPGTASARDQAMLPDPVHRSSTRTGSADFP